MPSSESYKVTNWIKQNLPFITDVEYFSDGVLHNIIYAQSVSVFKITDLDLFSTILICNQYQIDETRPKGENAQNLNFRHGGVAGLHEHTMRWSNEKILYST